MTFTLGADKVFRNSRGIEITSFGWGVLYCDTNVGRTMHFRSIYVSGINSVFLIPHKSTWEDGTTLSDSERTQIKSDLQLAFSEYSTETVEFDR